jgi:hypothetical protein
MQYSAETAIIFSVDRLILHCAMFTIEKYADLFATLQCKGSHRDRQVEVKFVSRIGLVRTGAAVTGIETVGYREADRVCT